MINDAFQLTYNEWVKIHLIVTYSCNFSCTYCIVWKDPLKNEVKWTYFSSENIVSLKEFITNFVRSKSITVHIIWWEPFINFPRLLELIQNLIWLNNIDLLYVSTNGFFVNSSNLSLLHGVTETYPGKFQLAFSIDGDPQFVSWSNRVFQNKVIKNFILAQQILWSECVRIAMVIMPQSAKFFHKNIEFLFSLQPGLLEFALQKWCIWDDGTINTLIATYSSFVKNYIKYKDVFSKTIFDIWINDTNNDMPCSKWKDHNITPEWYFIPCVSYLTSWDRDVAIFPYKLSEIVKNSSFFSELLLWSEKYFLKSFQLEWEDPSRIDFAHCIRTGIKNDEAFSNTKNNLKRFDKFRKAIIRKLIL
jgi:sulfatase maturation enzyme AslB (radical SAM superfamily)